MGFPGMTKIPKPPKLPSVHPAMQNAIAHILAGKAPPMKEDGTLLSKGMPGSRGGMMARLKARKAARQSMGPKAQGEYQSFQE